MGLVTKRGCGPLILIQRLRPAAPPKHARYDRLGGTVLPLEGQEVRSDRGFARGAKEVMAIGS